ncbi:MAG: DUF4430 domain-containing protein [Clostridia bacterium]|nr:DUF4430 domain-containing protein [Clostridia bacterium]
MKRKILQSLICVILAILSLASAFPVCAADADSLADGIFEYAVLAEGVDSLQAWADSCECGDEWFVFAIAQSEESVDFKEYYTSIKKYTEEKENIASVEALRIALAMVSVGAGEDPFVSEALADHTGKQGIMSLVFGLHLLNNGISGGDLSPESVVSEILELQGEDGGWSLDGKASDVDITSMVLQSLAMCKSVDGVEESAELAFAFLEAKIQPDGEFVSYGVKNAESAAQVVLALTSWGRDPRTEEAFIRNGRDLTDVLSGYCLPDGSVSHTAGGNTSRIATAQSACAFVAIDRLEKVKTPFFVMDAPSADFILEEKSDISLGYKFWVCAAVALLSVGGIGAILILKKNRKNIVFILLVAAVLVSAVLLTDIRSEKDYFYSQREKTNPIGTVSIEIDCSSVAGREAHIPQDGVLVSKRELTLYEGDTVYDILTDALKEEGLLFEHQGANYIVAVSNIAERQFGDLSGWVYYVNRERPSVGCGEYLLSDGDEILWAYSLEMGKDIEFEGK